MRKLLARSLAAKLPQVWSSIWIKRWQHSTGDEDIGTDMYKIMQWLEPKIVRDTALTKICT